MPTTLGSSRSRIRTAAIVLSALLITAALAAQPQWRALARDAAESYLAPSPHDRYAARLRLGAFWANLPLIGRSPPASRSVAAWLNAADAAFAQARPARATFSADGALRPPDAVAWRFPVRRGYRIVTVASFDRDRLFLDLFDASTRIRVASAGENDKSLEFDVQADGELVLRAQAALDAAGTYRVHAEAGPSMAFPVQGRTPHAVRSPFGAPRDRGAREHEGIDIFAPRGTPVLAATDGWIGASTANRLGGNVVWVWQPLRRVSTYYAHLDRRAMAPGERVKAGDVVGFVGDTGNARGGPTHLHFGIYVSGDGSVDPLPYVCGASCSR
jgi:murein DD-endopeptidase MepM/ murein hydrolase activator NlpD